MSNFQLSSLSNQQLGGLKAAVEEEFLKAININTRISVEDLLNFLHILQDISSDYEGVTSYYSMNIVDLSTSMFQRIEAAIEEFVILAQNDPQSLLRLIEEPQEMYAKIMKPNVEKVQYLMDTASHKLDVLSATLKDIYLVPLDQEKTTSFSQSLSQIVNIMNDTVHTLLSFQVNSYYDIVVTAESLFELDLNMDDPVLPQVTIIDKDERKKCQDYFVELIELIFCIRRDIDSFDWVECAPKFCMQKTDRKYTPSSLEGSVPGLDEFCAVSSDISDVDSQYVHADLVAIFHHLSVWRGRKEKLFTCLTTYEMFLIDFDNQADLQSRIPQYKFSGNFHISDELDLLKNVYNDFHQMTTAYASSSITKQEMVSSATSSAQQILSHIEGINLKIDQGLLSPLQTVIQEIKIIIQDHYMNFISNSATMEEYFSSMSDRITRVVQGAELWKQPMPELQSLDVINYLEDENAGRNLIQSGINAFASSQASYVINEYIAQFLDKLSDEANEIFSEITSYETKMNSHIQKLGEEERALEELTEVGEDFVR